MYKIYSLNEPRFSNVIRYVGLTGRNLETRFKQHLSEKRGTRKNNWIHLLKINGLTPKIKLLEDNIPTLEQAKRKEIMYVRMFKDLGYDLTNLTSGGDGLFGYKHTELAKKKMSDGMKGKMSGEKNPMYGKTHTEEVKGKLSKIHKGKINSPEARLKMSIALKGRKHSLEHIKKIGAANTGKKKSPEAIEKHRQSLTGFKHSDATRMNMSIASKRRKRTPMSDESKMKMSLSHKGIKLSEEHKEKIRQANFRTGNKPPIAIGENHPRAKLTSANVIKIRELRKAGLSHNKLANLFQVSNWVIYNLLKGKTWTSVK